MDEKEQSDGDWPSGEQKAVRLPNGTFAPGHTPPGAVPFVPGQSGNPEGRPKGHSILTPVLRRLRASPNEHGEGALAVALAGRLLDAADALACGVPKGITIDVGPILKLMERTDPEVKRSSVHVYGDSGIVPMDGD